MKPKLVAKMGHRNEMNFADTRVGTIVVNRAPTDDKMLKMSLGDIKPEFDVNLFIGVNVFMDNSNPSLVIIEDDESGEGIEIQFTSDLDTTLSLLVNGSTMFMNIMEVNKTIRLLNKHCKEVFNQINQSINQL